MKKRLLSVLAAGVMASSLFAAFPAAVYADGTMVVTIGADLTDAQKNAILQYFGVAGNTGVEQITVTNTDERNHLSSWVPIEQIGTKTISCALVKPASSGGIQVKTANLNYITSNMIASNMATSGITNCQVLAAAPFEVSGTGALTGVLMAYEKATGTTLDASKKDVAVQELVTTSDLAASVGQQEAQQIVNDVKMQVIEGSTVDQSSDNSTNDNSVSNEEINNIVNNVVNNYTTNNTTTNGLSSSDIEKLTALAQQIAQQSYDKGVETTLAQIQSQIQNVTGQSSTPEVQAQVDEVQKTAETEQQTEASSAETETPSSDSQAAFFNTDADALKSLNGTDSLVESATDEKNIDASDGTTDLNTTIPGTTASDGTQTPASENSGITITTTDSSTIGQSETNADNTAAAETTAQTDAEAISETAAPADASSGTPAAAATITADDVNSGKARVTFASANGEDPAAGSMLISYELPYDNLSIKEGTVPTLKVTDASGAEVANLSALLDDNAAEVMQKYIKSSSLGSDETAPDGWTGYTKITLAALDVNSKTPFSAQPGQTYTVTFDAVLTDGTQDYQAAIDNYQKSMNPVGEAGFQISDLDLSTLMANNQFFGTVLFPSDGSAAYAVITADDGSLVSVSDGSDRITNGAGQTVSVTPVQSGNLVLTISYYGADAAQDSTEADAAAPQAAPVSTVTFTVPVTQ